MILFPTFLLVRVSCYHGFVPAPMWYADTVMAQVGLVDTVLRSHASYYPFHEQGPHRSNSSSFSSSAPGVFSAEFSPRLRRRCLRRLSRYGRHHGLFVAPSGADVVFEVTNGYNSEYACMYFLLPFFAIAAHVNVMVVCAPDWVYLAMCALPHSPTGNLAPAQVGSQTYTPTAETLACALKLWDFDSDSPYYQFSDAISAAARLV